MRWIGLTGGIATGKSTVGEILRHNNIAVVDADQIARDVVQPGEPGFIKVVAAFGSQILQADGNIDRRKLGTIVFSDTSKRQLLESIIHPLIRNKVLAIRAELARKSQRFAVYEIPLLFEKDLQGDFDSTVVVIADEKTQKQRLKARSKLTDQEISDRLAAQLPLSEKVKRATAVIENSGTLQELEHKVLAWVRSVSN